MTAAATRKLISQYYAAFNAQDVDGMLACLGSGFVHDVSQGEARKGKDKFAAFLAHMNSSYKEVLSDIVGEIADITQDKDVQFAYREWYRSLVHIGLSMAKENGHVPA